MATAGPVRVVLPSRERGPGRAMATRVLIAAGCIAVTATVVYLERADYRDLDGSVDSWIDAVYYSTVTLSTTGYGDIVPVTDTARLTNIVLIMPLRFLFLIVLIGTTIEVLTEHSRQQLRSNRWRRRAKRHTVVVGYGMKGRAAVRALVDHGTRPARIVVVDLDGGNVAVATRDGCAGVLGDARREDVLRQAAVPVAGHVIVTTDRDDTTVLVTLTARRLAPAAVIAAAAREEQNITVLRQGGADVVIPTAEAAGRLLGMSLMSADAGGVIEDLLRPLAGLQISERHVRPDDVGRTPARLSTGGEIVLTVIRHGVAHRFDSGMVKVFQPGDLIVVITADQDGGQSAAQPDQD